MEFNNVRVNSTDLYNISLLSLEGFLATEDLERLKRIKTAWNFYEGYHWEDIPQVDKPQITENYCRPFVNKFVAFELGGGFNISYRDKEVEEVQVNDEHTLLSYLNHVWEDNSKNKLCLELGQMKSITGDGWVQVKYFSPEELEDPFGEYPNGRIRVMVIPTNVVFPEYDEHDKEKLTKITIMYPIEVKNESPILKRTKFTKIVYRQEWTKDYVSIYHGRELLATLPNRYNVIPFVQIKNFPVAGRETGIGDLEDLIPLNVELNLKKSDISEIIDYHSAPITLVYGAKVSALEKGANKIWGGLPKDSRVENLQLNGDLTASVSYVDELKGAMHDIGGVPKGALGGTQAISNTSGVALQFVNMPLIERTNTKRMSTIHGLSSINKLIIHMSLVEGLIVKPEEVPMYKFLNTDIEINDTLPKDMLIELQQIQQEITLGLESKKGAMKRLGKDNIQELLEEIEEEKQQDLEFSQQAVQVEEQAKLNSGFTNGQTPIEQVRKEITGSNGGEMV